MRTRAQSPRRVPQTKVWRTFIGAIGVNQRRSSRQQLGARAPLPLSTWGGGNRAPQIPSPCRPYTQTEALLGSLGANSLVSTINDAGITSRSYYWTGTDYDGSVAVGDDPTRVATCNGFTSSSGDTQGILGAASFTTAWWLGGFVVTSCDTQQVLLCIAY